MVESEHPYEAKAANWFRLEALLWSAANSVVIRTNNEKIGGREGSFSGCWQTKFPRNFLRQPDCFDACLSQSCLCLATGKEVVIQEVSRRRIQSILFRQGFRWTKEVTIPGAAALVVHFYNKSCTYETRLKAYRSWWRKLLSLQENTGAKEVWGLCLAPEASIS